MFTPLRSQTITSASLHIVVVAMMLFTMRSQCCVLICLVVCMLISSTQGKVLELSHTNFDATAKSTPILLLEFYAPWCRYCQRFADAYEQVALHFGEQSVLVARADGSAQPMFAKRFKVAAFPSFYLIHDDGVVHEYVGPRTVDELVQFVSSKGKRGGKKLNLFLGPFHIYWKSIAFVLRHAELARTWIAKHPVAPLTAVALAVVLVLSILFAFGLFIYFITKPDIQRPHTD